MKKRMGNFEISISIREIVSTKKQNKTAKRVTNLNPLTEHLVKRSKNIAKTNKINVFNFLKSNSARSYTAKQIAKKTNLYVGTVRKILNGNNVNIEARQRPNNGRIGCPSIVYRYYH